MKEVIAKVRKTQLLFPLKVIVSKIQIIEGKRIAHEFYNFFINIDRELLKGTLEPARSFKNYVPKFNTAMPTGPIRVDELKNTLFSRKTNKCSNFSVTRSYCIHFCEPLQYLFNLSFKNIIFPDNVKIAKAKPGFKVSNNTKLINYRPISVLPCYSKLLKIT